MGPPIHRLGRWSRAVVSARRASAVVVRPSPSLPHRWGGRPAPCAHLQVGWYSLSPCDLRERPCSGPDAEGGDGTAIGEQGGGHPGNDAAGPTAIPLPCIGALPQERATAPTPACRQAPRRAAPPGLPTLPSTEERPSPFPLKEGHGAAPPDAHRGAAPLSPVGGGWGRS